MHAAQKNVTSIRDGRGGLRANYGYAPFGALTLQEGDMVEKNKFRFSFEYSDDELGLIYYNYRHLNPLDGRCISRDPIAEQGEKHLQSFLNNRVMQACDVLGLFPWGQQQQQPPVSLFARINKNYINCIGHATGVGGGLYPNGSASLEQLFASLGWQCSDFNGKCDCNCKSEQVIVVFVYSISPENMGINRDAKTVLEYFESLKRAINNSRLDVWRAPWNTEVQPKTQHRGLITVDYHGMKRNCSRKNGTPKSWEYVAANFKKNDPNSAVHYRDSPNYFNLPSQVLKSKCCRKKRK